MERERFNQEHASRVIQQERNSNANNIVDNRPESSLSFMFSPTLQMESEDEEILQGRFNALIQRENETGMPDNLKAGIENLSCFSMNDVRVHCDISKPASVQALPYTQGTEIYVAQEQEKHLPHEAWHVAQQMSDHVSPTTRINNITGNNCESQTNVLQRRHLDGHIRVSGGHIVLSGIPTHPQGTPIRNLFYGNYQGNGKNIIHSKYFDNVATMGHLIRCAWFGHNEPEYICQWSDQNETEWANVENKVEKKATGMIKDPKKTRDIPIQVDTDELHLGDKIMGGSFTDSQMKFNNISQIQYVDAKNTLNRQVRNVKISVDGKLVAERQFDEPATLSTK